MNRHMILHCTFHDPSARRFRKMSMGVTFILKISIFLGFVFFLQACDTLKTAKEPKKMPIPEKISVIQAAKPPVDISAPDKTETATFALG